MKRLQQDGAGAQKMRQRGAAAIFACDYVHAALRRWCTTEKEVVA